MADITNQLQSAAGAAGGGTSGSYLAVQAFVSSAQRVLLLDHTTPGTLTSAATYATAGAPRATHFSPDGKYLAVASQTTPYFTLLDHTTPGSLSLATTYTLNGSTNGNPAVAFAPSGNYIATFVGGSNTQPLTLLNHTTPGTVTLATTYTLIGPIIALYANGLQFSPDGNYLVTGAGSTVTLLNHTTPGSLSLATTYTTRGSTSQIARNCNFARFSRDGDYIACSCSGSANGDGPIQVALLDHTTPGTLSLATTYNLPATYGPPFVNSFIEDGDFSSNGYLAAATWNSFDDTTDTIPVTLLNHTTPGSLSFSATYGTDSFGARNIRFSPDDKYLATTVGNTSFIFSLLLLNHTTPGSLSFATTYNASSISGISWSPV